MAHVTKGNVFEDLGFSREVAADLAMKVDLARDVRKFIERQGLTQAQAADFFEVPRPKISHIQSNKLDGISIEYLVRMLTKTGGKLSYHFRQPSKRAAQARVRASAAA
jgi:predicted XRE-type DNA-binding protein